jgi:hypothetical protein
MADAQNPTVASAAFATVPAVAAAAKVSIAAVQVTLVPDELVQKIVDFMTGVAVEAGHEGAYCRCAHAENLVAQLENCVRHDYSSET